MTETQGNILLLKKEDYNYKNEDRTALWVVNLDDMKLSKFNVDRIMSNELDPDMYADFDQDKVPVLSPIWEDSGFYRKLKGFAHVGYLNYEIDKI